MASSTRGLLFLQLGLGRGPDFDDRDTAHQLGQPLLQLLAVVVRARVLDLRPELFDAPAIDSACRRRRRWSVVSLSIVIFFA
jgi:hypothetical protein